ncbi:hypothetical protein E3T54_10895 [Cryobacterium sp. Sr8]|uniref:hypothetical protein n=1 Tax=Cryobacterium sp. Sr8 TaxID=1259203 RepID=UPI001069886B|nr:hypothetical protein [Cryobacterium sp. Sr8]TFD76081.1 hypothetical protein E3T54_10895 [Cryobacterium sp. Sr8]
MINFVAGLHLPGVAAQTEPASAAQPPLPVLEQPAAAVVQPPAPQPESIPAATQQEEWGTVVQTAGTLAYVMNRITPAGHPWPASLAVTTDNRRVMTPTGEVLGMVPRGAELSYQPSADLSGYTLTVTGSTFGVIAEFSSYTGEVTTR